MAGTPASIQGARTTSNILSANIVKNVAPAVLMLEDDRKSLMTFVSSLGTYATDNPQFDWFQDEIVPKAGTMGASAASASASTVSAALDLSGQGTGIYVNIDDDIKIPSTGEIVRVTAQPSQMTAVPVLRGINGVLSATIALGALWVKLGDARAENSRLYDTSDVLQSVSVQETSAYNYTQTFREPFGLSRRESKTKQYTGKDEARQKMKKLIEHCQKINLAFWHGGRISESGGRTHTGGLLSFIPSGNQSTIATLTEAEFENFVRRITRYGNSKRRVLFCSRYVASLISGWGRAAQRINNPGGTVKYGVHVTEYQAGCGTTVEIVTDHALEGLPGSSTLGTWDGYGALVDPEGMKKAVFGGDDTTYAEGVQFADQDGKTNAYLSDVGLLPGHPTKHGLMIGVAS